MSSTPSQRAAAPGHMWRIGPAIALTLGLLLTACGSDDSAKHDRQHGDAAGSATGSFEEAIAVRQKSGCAKAMPMFQKLAERGRGYEVAELQLGECYLERADKAESPEQAKDMRVKAADWIVKAANADQPEAQQEAAKLYLDGIGVAANRIEAGKWFLILQHNPLRSVLGPAVLDQALTLHLQQGLSASDWQEAQSQANRWQPSGRTSQSHF